MFIDAQFQHGRSSECFCCFCPSNFKLVVLILKFILNERRTQKLKTHSVFFKVTVFIVFFHLFWLLSYIFLYSIYMYVGFIFFLGGGGGGWSFFVRFYTETILLTFKLLSFVHISLNSMLQFTSIDSLYFDVYFLCYISNYVSVLKKKHLVYAEDREQIVFNFERFFKTYFNLSYMYFM